MLNEDGDAAIKPIKTRVKGEGQWIIYDLVAS
jgi:hypothetical protein